MAETWAENQDMQIVDEADLDADAIDGRSLFLLGDGAWARRALDAAAPFGGYKQSGNGREWGHHGIDEFLELKSIYGYEKRQK